VIEEIEAIGDFGVDILTKLIINDIYYTGYLPQDLKKSIFIPLRKKDDAVECEDHRTICIMSHVTKIFLRVILRRIRNKIRPEIAEVQCRFVKDSGTRNAIYIIRTLFERTIEVKINQYLCFIDYTKVFDKVRHKKLIDILNSINIDGKDIRLIRNLY
jgi:hypothetical protein